MPIEIVELPIKDSDFPVRKLLLYQSFPESNSKFHQELMDFFTTRHLDAKSKGISDRIAQQQLHQSLRVAAPGPPGPPGGAPAQPPLGGGGGEARHAAGGHCGKLWGLGAWIWGVKIGGKDRVFLGMCIFLSGEIR